MVMHILRMYNSKNPRTWDDSLVDFGSIVRNYPNHGQWENARPLSGIRVDLVRDQIGLDRVQIDLVEDQVVIVYD